MHNLRQIAEIVDGAEKVRILHDHGGHTVVQRRRHRRPVGHVVGRNRQFGQLQAEVARIPAHDQAVDRVDAPGQHDRVAPGGAHRRQQRLGQRRPAVVHRRVGGIQARQAADHRLILENSLQGSLGHLGLVGRVGGEELAAGRQAVHGGGDGVVIEPAAQKTDQTVRVLVRQRVQVVVNLLLAQAIGHVQRRQPQGRRYVGEQGINRVDADVRQHRVALRGGVGNKGHGQPRSAYAVTVCRIRRRLPASSTRPDRQASRR